MSKFESQGLIHKIQYQLMLHRKFDVPLTGVSAYLAKDVNSLNSKQFEQLQEYHHNVWSTISAGGLS